MIIKGETLQSQASLAVLMVLSMIIAFVASSAAELSYTGYINQDLSIKEAQVFSMSDSGLEIAFLEFQRYSSYAGQNLSTPLGNINISVTDLGGGFKDITSETVSSNIRREISASIYVEAQENPLEQFAAFGGDDIQLIKQNSTLVGNLWTNDNVDLDDSTTVQGDVYAAGLGNISNSSVRNGARIEDNPSTPEVEGNLFAMDRIRVVNSGYVEGTATSKKDVTVSSGGFVGASVVDPDLDIATIQIPDFDFDTYKTQAQTAGTYYNTAADFINYLSLNSNTITTGVHYIGSGVLTLSESGSYDITGSIISDDEIHIRGVSYTHMYENNLPAIAAKGDIFIEDANPCACEADITGIIYSQGDVQVKHDQYNGANPWANELLGAIWAGDKATLEDYSKLTFDMGIVENAEGFSFQTVGGPDPDSTNNIVTIQQWNIE